MSVHVACLGFRLEMCVFHVCRLEEILKEQEGLSGTSGSSRLSALLRLKTQQPQTVFDAASKDASMYSARSMFSMLQFPYTSISGSLFLPASPTRDFRWAFFLVFWSVGMFLPIFAW